jgi:hypothetical protein
MCAVPSGLEDEAMLAPGEGPEMVSRTLFQYAGWNLAAEWDQFGGASAPRTLVARYYREGGLDSTFAATFGAGASAKDYVAITDHLGSPIVLLRVQAGGALGFLAEPAESI